MGLFSAKKQSKEVLRFPRPPEKTSFPEYRPQMPIPEPLRIKLPELRPEESIGFNMPIRRPEMPRPMMPEELAPTLPLSTSLGSQPLFVKIDKYRAAIRALDEIKQRISDAESTLARLNAIKIKETDEITQWEGEIRNIKEKLMAIDKNLFEE